ncbi:MAG: hemolysin family protein [Thermodesulfobacteriota bacterium]
MTLEATIAVVVFCIALQAFFAGSEIALISCDKIRMKNLAAGGSRPARLVLKSHSDIERFLTTTLAGINISLITSTILLTFYIEENYGGGELYSVLILSPLVVVFGQVVPKSVFRRKSDTAVLWVIYPLWAASKIFLPLTWVVSIFTRFALRHAGPLTSVTRGQIMDAIRAHDDDSADSEKRRMLGRVFSFSEVTVGDIMVPLSSVKALDEEATVSEATELVRVSGYTRIPVYKERLDRITGVLHSFFLLGGSAGGPGAPAGNYSSPALYVTEKKHANELLEEMKAGGNTMAVVVDEYGVAAGIVTLEDILEEIVGEIEDEHDRGENLWLKTGAGEYLVFPHISIERANEDLAIAIPENKSYETLGGFLLSRFRRIPSEGETLEACGAIFTVESATPRAIKRVRVVSTG